MTDLVMEEVVLWVAKRPSVDGGHCARGKGGVCVLFKIYFAETNRD